MFLLWCADTLTNIDPATSRQNGTQLCWALQVEGPDRFGKKFQQVGNIRIIVRVPYRENIIYRKVLGCWERRKK